MFYFSYLFSVLFLAFFIIILILVYISRIFYLKYLVILVYISGVVIFILYISCMCWFVSNSFSKLFLILGIFIIYLFDNGLYRKFSDVAEFF